VAADRISGPTAVMPRRGEGRRRCSRVVASWFGPRRLCLDAASFGVSAACLGFVGSRAYASAGTVRHAAGAIRPGGGCGVGEGTGAGASFLRGIRTAEPDLWLSSSVSDARPQRPGHLPLKHDLGRGDGARDRLRGGGDGAVTGALLVGRSPRARLRGALDRRRPVCGFALAATGSAEAWRASPLASARSWDVPVSRDLLDVAAAGSHPEHLLGRVTSASGPSTTRGSGGSGRSHLGAQRYGAASVCWSPGLLPVHAMLAAVHPGPLRPPGTVGDPA